MPRRYRRRRYAIARPVKTVKYSNETYSGRWVVENQPSGGMPDIYENTAMVVKTDVQATRKVKNFTLRIGIGPVFMKNSDPATEEVMVNGTFAFALVFVPQGTNPSTFTPSASDEAAVTLYEPNQNVIMSGYGSTNNGIMTFKTRLARNLNSGDQIYLLLRDVSDLPISTYDTVTSYKILYSLNYAITY